MRTEKLIGELQNALDNGREEISELHLALGILTWDAPLSNTPDKSKLSRRVYIPFGLISVPGVVERIEISDTDRAYGAQSGRGLLNCYVEVRVLKSDIPDEDEFWEQTQLDHIEETSDSYVFNVPISELTNKDIAELMH